MHTAKKLITGYMRDVRHYMIDLSGESMRSVNLGVLIAHAESLATNDLLYRLVEQAGPPGWTVKGTVSHPTMCRLRDRLRSIGSRDTPITPAAAAIWLETWLRGFREAIKFRYRHRLSAERDDDEFGAGITEAEDRVGALWGD